MIKVEKVKYSYDGAETPALKGISFEINKGDFVAIVGHNGSGKSTVAKLLNALLIPDEGSITVDGMSTADEADVLNIRKKVGVVFQNPDNQIVTTVVEEDVGFGPENLGLPTEEILTRVHDALEAVDMLPYARSAPHMLSGGQKQRIAIAGMLALSPEVLVLDEATAMLDPIGRSEVLSTIERLHKQDGITVVLITHHMNEAENADRVIVMNDGRLAMDGAPREIFSRKAELEKLGLTVPDTVLLLDSLRQGGMDVPLDAVTVDECVDAIMKNF